MSFDITSAQYIATVHATSLAQHYNNASLTHPLTKWRARRKASLRADGGHFEHML